MHTLQILLHYLLRYANSIDFFSSLVTWVLFLYSFLPRFYVITFRPFLTFSCFTTFTTRHFEPTYPLYQRPKLSTEIRAGWNNIRASVATLAFFVTQMSNVEREIRKKVVSRVKKSNWIENKLPGWEQNYCTFFHIDSVIWQRGKWQVKYIPEEEITCWWHWTGISYFEIRRNFCHSKDTVFISILKSILLFCLKQWRKKLDILSIRILYFDRVFSKIKNWQLLDKFHRKIQINKMFPGLP